MTELGRLPPRRRPPCRNFDPNDAVGGLRMADCRTCGGLRLASHPDCVPAGFWRRVWFVLKRVVWP